MPLPDRYIVAPLGESGGHCDCCGTQSRCVWGSLESADGAHTVYYVHWTVGDVRDHAAHFDLVLGPWGEAHPATSRALAALDYRLLDNGPAFRAIDGEPRLALCSSLAARAFQRADVIGTPLADIVFAMADTVLARDSRLAELLGSWTIDL
jgi:hypothetical protein